MRRALHSEPEASGRVRLAPNAPSPGRSRSYGSVTVRTKTQRRASEPGKAQLLASRPIHSLIDYGWVFTDSQRPIRLLRLSPPP